METEIREVPSPGGPPKIIKRYANRKLYDTGESRYVTLEEIGTMVKQGIEVQIVDNRSKGDLTSVTLAQIILEEEKKRNRMPLEVLRDIIRNGGESISGFIQREVQPRVTSLREEAEASLKLLRRDGPGDKPRELLGALQAMLLEWQGRGRRAAACGGRDHELVSADRARAPADRRSARGARAKNRSPGR